MTFYYYFLIQGIPLALVITLNLLVLNQIAGAFLMINYSNKVFENGSLSRSTASFTIASIQLLANCVSMVLLNYTERKNLLFIVCTVGSVLGLLFTGLYDLHENQLDTYEWVPVALFSSSILMASFGILTFLINWLNWMIFYWNRSNPPSAFVHIWTTIEYLFTRNIFFKKKKGTQNMKRAIKSWKWNICLEMLFIASKFNQSK